MNQKQDISDELLNAFVDGQLDADERGRVLEATREDKELASRVCELRHVKEITQHAYQGARPSAPKGKKRRGRAERLAKSAAAAVLLCTGLALGWLAHDQLQTPPQVASIFDMNDAKRLALSGSSEQVKRIILHLSTGDPERVKAALDATDELMQSYDRQPGQIRVEIIANAEGLNLLRADVSPFGQRVQRMVKTYPGQLSFLACSKAIQRLKEKGIDVRLVPAAERAPSALQQIIQRLREGWVYIKV